MFTPCIQSLLPKAVSQVGLPPEIVFGDEEAILYQNLRFVNSDFSEDSERCHLGHSFFSEPKHFLRFWFPCPDVSR